MRLPAMLCALLLAAPPALCDGATRLIQSAPSETALAHPALPFARDAWVEVIRGARERLDFAEFYIAQVPGGALEPVLAALEDAGRRGVRIRFVLSSRMLDQDKASLERLKAVKGLELRIFDMKGVSSGILHAKYFLADGREAVLGSQNFDWRALEHIHELGIRSTEPAIVDRLQAVFEADWAFAKDHARPAAGPRPAPAGDLELVASPPFLNPAGVRPALDALVELIDGAKTSVQVQLLQYSPVARKGTYWPAIDRALRAASVRGVKVRLLISDWVFKSRGLAHLKSLAVLPGVEVRIASVPEASTGHIPFARTIHSKYMVVDGAVLWLGTSNWEEDYFEASRNVEAILRRPEPARQAMEVFERVWTAPFTKVLDPVGTYAPRKVD
ncbi:MAG TPA: phospholipase D-like domain-containing protein [Holophaga sp.]|nr:phospholipase D-like domain-containing protein [Holophaga sp.]